jgi:hypothetical protein
LPTPGIERTKTAIVIFKIKKGFLTNHNLCLPAYVNLRCKQKRKKVMKKNVLLAIALVMSVAVAAVAKEVPGAARLAVVPVKGSEVYKVVYKNEGATRLKLNIYNGASQLIFSETVTGDGFIRPLNFTGLKAGEYTIEISDAGSKTSEKIYYEPLKSSDSSRKVVHVSKMTDGENKFLVSVARVANEKITINIYDANDRVIHTESRAVDGGFAQIYTVKSGKVAAIEVVDQNGNINTSRF